MGIKPFIDKTKYSSLPMLKSIFIPDGIDDSSFRQNLLLKHNIEIGSGLGPTKGKIWRIGVMGHNSRKDIIDYSSCPYHYFLLYIFDMSNST